MFGGFETSFQLSLCISLYWFASGKELGDEQFFSRPIERESAETMRLRQHVDSSRHECSVDSLGPLFPIDVLYVNTRDIFRVRVSSCVVKVAFFMHVLAVLPGMIEKAFIPFHTFQSNFRSFCINYCHNLLFNFARITKGNTAGRGNPFISNIWGINQTDVPIFRSRVTSVLLCTIFVLAIFHAKL